MKTSFLLIISLGLFSACTAQTTSVISEATAASVTATPELTQELMEIINEHRTSLSLDPLVFDDGLSSIAQEHSEAMAAKEREFGHDGFSTRCSEAREVLGGGNLCSENVAQDQRNPKEVFNSWMKSPGHRSHIENSRLTHTGLAYSVDETGIIFWTEIFVEYK